MKKIFMVTLFAVLSCVTLQNTAIAEGECVLAPNCANNGDKKGNKNTVLSTSGLLGDAAQNAGGQCYRCNWGDDQYECAADKVVVAIMHPDHQIEKSKHYNEVVNFFTCSDTDPYDDDWDLYNPNDTCPDSPVAAGDPHAEHYYVIGESITEVMHTNQNSTVFHKAGSIGCKMFRCKEGYEAKDLKCVDKKQQKAKAAQQAANNKKSAEKCRDSGGSWSNGKCVCNKVHMMESNGVCVCDGPEYEIQGGYCVMKNSVMRQQACLAASGATWNPTLKQCECNNASMYSWNGTQCVEREDVVLCRSISGAIWNNGCMCTKSGYIIDYASKACIEDPDIVAKNKIIAAGRVLDGIAAGFDVSVWKNAQGEFNTARLASDSIAGVVLGTVGGVVTSSVMKKHQVEDGFEDLKCTIGGQPVAGWGDEFNVGVQ